MAIRTNIKVGGLGPGAGYALWGFRASAIGHVQCPTLIRGFDEAFGDHSRPALGGIQLLARELGMSGGRRITIACLGCGFVTADEISIAAMLSAAQRGDGDLCDAHLTWLMCGKWQGTARSAAFSIASVFRTTGLNIVKPDVELVAGAPAKSFTSYHEIGHA